MWNDPYLQEQLTLGKRGIIHPIQECYAMLDIADAINGDGTGQLISLPRIVLKYGAELIEEKTHQCLEFNTDKVNDFADKTQPWVALDSQGGMMWIMPREKDLIYKRIGFDYQGSICEEQKIQYSPCCARFVPVGMIDRNEKVTSFSCGTHGMKWVWNKKGQVKGPND